MNTDKGARRQFKTAVYQQLARIGKAVSSPPRLEILDLLGQSPRTVEELSRMTEQGFANVSQHLQVLRAARLVESEKEGLHVRYRLASDDVGVFLVAVRTLAEARLLELEDVVTATFLNNGEVEEIDQAALVKRVKSGAVTVIDVRPIEEYNAGHIPGALSIPIGELRNRLKQLPKSREVVAYCRGRYCIYALDAVKVLRANGFKAQRLESGVTEWKARGLRIDRVSARSPSPSPSPSPSLSLSQ